MKHTITKYAGLEKFARLLIADMNDCIGRLDEMAASPSFKNDKEHSRRISAKSEGLKLGRTMLLNWLRFYEIELKGELT
jgi:hypothetical protein